MATSDTIPCSCCSRLTPIEALDAKPSMTAELHAMSLERGQEQMLRYAADHGYDFDQLECEPCYGSGWSAP
jgi:hypothetical protein